jgi:hypothetical protein
MEASERSRGRSQAQAHFEDINVSEMGDVSAFCRIFTWAKFSDGYAEMFNRPDRPGAMVIPMSGFLRVAADAGRQGAAIIPSTAAICLVSRDRSAAMPNPMQEFEISDFNVVQTDDRLAAYIICDQSNGDRVLLLTDWVRLVELRTQLNAALEPQARTLPHHQAERG